jgi:hypothetical protein
MTTPTKSETQGPTASDLAAAKALQEGIPAADAAAGRALRGVRIATMKASLAKQKTVSMIVPHEFGHAGETSWIANGYQLRIPTGVQVDLPQQVADAFLDRMSFEAHKAAKIATPWVAPRHEYPE